MGASIRVGKIFGIPIQINYSWIFIFLLFTYVLADSFSHSDPDWPAAQRWGVGALTAVLFFLSVLAHELTHSVVAIRKGIPVRGITLFIFGGVSQLAHEARRPFTEFLIAVVGPLASVILGAVLFGVWYLVDDVNATLSAVLFFLATINISLGVFNMLPGFPLDGGRVMRAAVWGLTGSYWRATQVATRSGQVIGGLMVIGGVLLVVFGAGFQSIWLAFIGAFLFSAATASYRQERDRERLKSYSVADAVAPDLRVLPWDTPLDSTIVSEELARGGGLVAVGGEGRIDGVLTRRALERVSNRDLPVTSSSQGMIPLDSFPSVNHDASIADALEQMEDDGLDQLAVRQHGVLVGFISHDAIIRLVRALRKTAT
ncbi:MAG: site-2 protease family protein [Chloroflexi bacterium]|nr:site-2 protease family protein [Chloroflexota bacterium]